MKKDKKSCCNKKVIKNKINAQEKGKEYFKETNENEENINDNNQDK